MSRPSRCERTYTLGRVSALARTTGLLRDLLIAAVGWLTLTAPPASITMLDTTSSSTTVWSLMLLGGGVAAAAGLLSGRVILEATGCGLMAAGFLVWTWAALAQPEVERITVAVALVFLAGMVGQLQQTVTAAAGVFARGRS